MSEQRTMSLDSIQQRTDIYRDVMYRIRQHFDLIDQIKELKLICDFAVLEICASNIRKIIEGIAFGCLIIAEHGGETVPKKAKREFNAEKTLKWLEKKNVEVFPTPSVIRSFTADDIEEATKYTTGLDNISATIEGQPQLIVTRNELKKIYNEMHHLCHEANPYLQNRGLNLTDVLSYMKKIKDFIWKHTISWQGKMFFCVLCDNVDRLTKVLPLSKEGKSNIVAQE